MRQFLVFFWVALAPASATFAEAPDLVGRYRLSEGHEAAGELVIAADGRFDYALAYGALDEAAHGRWQRESEAICLYSEPKPMPPAFSRAPAGKAAGQDATILVIGPNGHGIAGIDFRIGFDSGEPVEGYTQVYGFTLDPAEHRVPRWIELYEPIYQIEAPRFTLAPEDNGRLLATLTPNDLGMVDFEGACLEAAEQGFVLHRKEGDMHFTADGH